MLGFNLKTFLPFCVIDSPVLQVLKSKSTYLYIPNYTPFSGFQSRFFTQLSMYLTMKLTHYKNFLCTSYIVCRIFTFNITRAKAFSKSRYLFSCNDFILLIFFSLYLGHLTGRKKNLVQRGGGNFMGLNGMVAC